jgi:hypothetical protein
MSLSLVVAYYESDSMLYLLERDQVMLLCSHILYSKVTPGG